MGKAKAQTKHLRKKGAEKAPKQTNLTGLKKPGDPPASLTNGPLQIQVSSRRPRLSSDPEEEKTEHNTTAAKKPCTKVHGQPPHRAKAHQGKSKAQKPKLNACAEHLRGQGEQKGAKNQHKQKEPSHP